MPVIDMRATGARIRLLMQLRGLSVREVQEYLGMPYPQSIYHWFHGRNLPTPDHLYALSELLQVPVDLLLCGNRRYDPQAELFAARQRMRLDFYARRLQRTAA